MALRMVVDPVAGKYRVRIVKDVPKRTSPLCCSPEEYLFDTRPVDVAVGNILWDKREDALIAGNNALVRFSTRQ